LDVPDRYDVLRSKRIKLADQQLINIIEGCVNNDRKCQELLYRQFFDTMFGMCIRYTRDEDLAMQIVNDGFLRVFKKIDQFRFEGSLEGWIRRLVFHALSDHYRKVNRECKFIDIEKAARVGQREQILSNLYLQDVYKLISNLPDATRAVFELYALEGYKHAEIGDQLGISEGTSKWHLSNARKLLKEMIASRQEINRTYAG
jgi:RNA polymerase sigma-70 factor (ECF subfamily)